MDEMFDLSKFSSYREGNRYEVKKASEGLPLSLWESYSSFANCYGGVIILGVKENKNGSWSTTGLHDKNRLQKDFWNTINNRKKVSANLLKEKDVEFFSIGRDVIMVIHVPMAKREEKPIYINDDIFGGTYRRNYDGDYHCSKLQVKTMIRDQADDTMDMNVLDDLPLSLLNGDSLRAYRNIFANLKPNHPFASLSDEEFLRSIGAASLSKEDERLHPTLAGLLMFGNEYDIVREFPNYFLDYRAELDDRTRWVDRVESSSGDFSGNVFDFYSRVYGKLKQLLPSSFRLIDGVRVDDAPAHEALRESLANCLINADYYGPRGVSIAIYPKRIVISNPGYSRVSLKQMLLGGVSDPRNRGLMKMFNLINIGERAGSGVPKIVSLWKKEGYRNPSIEEHFDPDRLILILPLEKKRKMKLIGEIEASGNMEKRESEIMDYLKDNGQSSCKDISRHLSLSESRTRAILAKMDGVEAIGANKIRVYRCK